MRILVTGAGGAVGSQLVGRLVADGHRVRALVRDSASRLPAEHDGGAPVEVFVTDVLGGEGLMRALREIEVAYYLIHSMERQRGDGGSAGFPERERTAAENFAVAARAAGVRRLVYLGGPVMRARKTSRHLASRRAVEEILCDAVPDAIALRASIVIGARSRSFRLMVRLIERLPVLVLPTWRSYRTRPIDARDVTEMLAACATAAVTGRLNIAGPDVLSYEEMISCIAELMLVHRPAVRLPTSGDPFTAPLAAAIAGEDPELVGALMEGLQGDLLPADDHAAQLLGVQLHSFQSAVEHALGEWERRESLVAR